MSLLTVERIGDQFPRLWQFPARAQGSAGDDAIEFAESIGFDPELGHGFYELDDWQKYCIRGLLSEDVNARLCAYVTLILVTRQNGKNVILEVVELYAWFVLNLKLILHTAHLAETSAEHMARLWDAISSDDDLASISDKREANGKERLVRLDTGAQITFKTRSKKLGRGGSPQMVVFDEALYLTDAQIQAMLPSLSAQSMRPDRPILIYTSSAPIPESIVLHRVRNAFIAGGLREGFYAEWSVDLVVAEHEDRMQAMRRIAEDRDGWYASNPGMGIRIDPEWVQANEVPMLSIEGFLTERCGVVFGADAGSGVIASDRWAACADAVELDGPGIPSLAVSADGTWAAFGFAARRDDGRMHIEVVRYESGTAWVVDEAKRATEANGCPLVLDPKSATVAVLKQLRLAGVELREVSLAEYVAGCAALQDDVINRRVAHLDQAMLNAAVAGTEIRPVGEAWAFSAKASAIDISPLNAVTLAVLVAGTDGDLRIW